VLGRKSFAHTIDCLPSTEPMEMALKVSIAADYAGVIEAFRL
jgi:hypothetical protein